MSNNLDISQVAAGQSSKEVTVNNATGQLDAALTELLDVNLSAGNVTLTSAQFRGAMMFNGTGHSVSRNLTVPAVKRSIFVVRNSGTGDLNVVRGSTTLTLFASTLAVFATDGTTNGLIIVSAPSDGSAPEAKFMDLSLFVAGAPTDSELVLYFIAVRDFTLPASLTGSYAHAGTASTGSVSFALTKNGGSIGSVSFAASATGTFTFASDTSFTAGDNLKMTAPATADATLADIAFSFKGSRP